jgi:hypothetical protein
MSKEMREQINKVKNFGQFLNENVNMEVNTDDGNTLTLIKVEKDPMAYWVELGGEIIGNVAGIGRFGDWSWSLKTDKVDTTSTFGIFKNKEDASTKVYNEYLKVRG